MKKIVLSTAICLSIASTLFGQQPTGTSSGILQVPLLESTTAATLQGSLWNITISNVEAEQDLYPAQSNIETIKYNLAQLRAKSAPVSSTPKQTRGLPPVQGTNFKANQLHSLVPTDNSMAISKNGFIVSADNWNLTYADSNGTIIKDSIVWNDFVNNNASLQQGKYDPKVIYDNVHDRFIVVILHGPADVVKNKVIIAFSKTNNPMQGWNLYTLSGNALNDSSWADYPSIGINNNELFINVNLFKGPPTYAYNQTAIYQVNLANGYGAGSSLSYKVWAGNITAPDGKPGFTLVPASDGMGAASKDASMYFVSNWPDGNDKVFVYKITDELFVPNTQLLAYQYTVPAFSVCANAFIYNPPNGYKDSISTGSSVVQNAYIMDSVLHYTYDANVDPGWCGLQYGRIDLRTQKAVIKKFGNPGTVLAYPAIASFGHTPKDKSAVICYLQTDTSLYPQVCAVAIDDAMNFSTPIVLKKGDTTVNVLYPPAQTNIPERWGDYTGIQRKYNTAVPEVWCAGAYGANNSRPAAYNTWVSQLRNAAYPLSIINPVASAAGSKVYPNPGYQHFTYSWHQANDEYTTISIVNLQGQVVKVLFADKSTEGDHTIEFNKGALAAGQYIMMLGKKNGMESVQFVVE
jgi:hypothetical protein